MESILTKKQVKTYGPRTDQKLVSVYGRGAMLTATVSYDDDDGNGHNTFSITGTVVTAASKRRHDTEAGGVLHEEIARLFPELAPHIKWHLTSSDGPPTPYVGSTLRWLGYSGFCDGKKDSPPNLAYARSAAVWPDMPEHWLVDSNASKEVNAARAADIRAQLEARKDSLMRDFRAAVESLGFTY